MWNVTRQPGAKWRARPGTQIHRARCEQTFFSLEQLIMKSMRSKRLRSLGFESLEGRLALSTGMGMAAASHHAHAVVMSQTQETATASFKGHVDISNGTMTTTNLRGTIGPDRFTGSGTGTVAGKLFEGGSVSLTNNSGSLQLTLGSSYTVKVRKHSRQEVNVVVAGGSGAYASYVGETGLLNTWNTPVKPSSTASFGGYLNV